MHRLVVRIAGLALCASALGGCGMLGLDEGPSAQGQRERAAATDTSPMAPDVTANVRQAQLLRSQGDTAGATRILSQLMLVEPDDPRVVGEYGKLLVQENRSADAIEFLHRAIELQPSDWMLYSALGVAYDQQSDATNARLAYDRALALKPGEPAVLNNFAMSRMLAGDTAMARTLLLQAKANGSTDPKIDTNIAMLDRMAPLPAPVAAAPVPAKAVATAAPHKTVARAELPPPPTTAPAQRAPVTVGGARVVMQDVPVDPLAGPVARKTHGAKPAKLAKRGAPARVAAVKPADKKKAKPAADHIPALRMTADAGKP
jgi:Flp pilus assembly protein TadD